MAREPYISTVDFNHDCVGRGMTEEEIIELREAIEALKRKFIEFVEMDTRHINDLTVITESAAETICDLRAQNAKLVEGLEYYADQKNYPTYKMPLSNGTSIEGHGLGYITPHKARETLESVRGK